MRRFHVLCRCFAPYSTYTPGSSAPVSSPDLTSNYLTPDWRTSYGKQLHALLLQLQVLLQLQLQLVVLPQLVLELEVALGAD